VHRRGTLGELAQPRQIPAQPAVVGLDDVGTQLRKRRGHPVGRLRRDRFDIPVEEDGDRRRIETLVGARLRQAAATAAAVVEAQPGQHPRCDRPLEHQLGEAAIEIDCHGRHAPSVERSRLFSLYTRCKRTILPNRTEYDLCIPEGCPKEMKDDA